MTSDQVEAHYIKLFGEPTREACFTGSGSSIQVYKWDERSNPEEVALYATLGISDQVLPDDPNHRIELFTGLLPAEDRIAKTLAMLGLYPDPEASELADGHTVTFTEPLWAGTEMSTYLVTEPDIEIIPVLQGTDGLHVIFLRVIPIYPSELEFKVKHGAEGLMKHWEQREVPFWNPNRTPNP